MPCLLQRERLWLIIAALFLTASGIVFVYSAGSYWGKIHYGQTAPFLVKQLIYLAIALTVFYACGRYKGLQLEKTWTLFYWLSLLLLVAVLIPGIGVVRNGSQSWIALGPLSLQPSELTKIATIIKLSFILSKQKATASKIHWKHFLYLFLPVALIMVQPDFGSAFILIVSVFLLFFIAGYPFRFYVFLIIAGVAGLVGLILSAPYRLKRIEAFLDPWSDPLGSGFQAIQSLMAIGPAGLYGFGFGNSRQKYLYLPEPQNDFIFSIITEEMGFLGAATIICAFGLLIYAGLRLAYKSSLKVSLYSIATLIGMIGFQAFLNIGVVSGLLPVTGVTLPFISYGGTSLVVTWIAIGIIWNFSRED
ncbi:putative lipid II flippase FtsW [Rummeliibacillus sp. G93]|uniref:Cell division protein FtsW n=1 Tax=Rummeliibacillus stabekisii TaxID=241244 RepID=A0A143HAI5_9BACL|nr:MULTISPECIES: putative lipid II flippase FtsW [Rummeliibacillus]AMW98341.1 cell division protein FtsW [Rummeliibacillus stabekisii]MBB5169967.1 cell division protein FtsW [Rummeliibacillus stabekisii]MCM3315729.1 putative lipid II flippase FtsW [Rummeliibacillus stabekisii]UQW98300.1 putative lipid II flippase FtsW [Rummeliibacillus sp. G93]GEL04225.1 stage V sporulation protein E [Rummeliibacillus stabekisii]